jgi:hypothetical protein
MNFCVFPFSTIFTIRSKKRTAFQRFFALFLFSLFLTGSAIAPEHLLLVADKPYTLDDKKWKVFFPSSTWSENDILEADSEHLFIQLTRSRIPKGMEWSQNSWGLWNVSKRSFLPLTDVPLNLIPLRKLGSKIIARNSESTMFYSIESGEKPSIILRSNLVRGFFPRFDGSILYLAQSDSCGSKMRYARKVQICLMDTTLANHESLGEVENPSNPMLTGDRDAYLVYWKFSANDKIWELSSFHINSGEESILGRSAFASSSISPKWLSWIGNDWVVYENMKEDTDGNGNGNGSSPSRAFLVHNIRSGQKKEILLEKGGRILLEPGNPGNKRKFHYKPFLIVLDYESEEKFIKIIDAQELKIVSETKFPFPEVLKQKEQATFYP